MDIKNLYGNLIIEASPGYKIINKNNPYRTYNKVYLGINDICDNYIEVRDNDYINQLPEEIPDTELAYLKKKKIEESKYNLSVFLNENPLYSFSHNNNAAYYTVTLEKQILLASKITNYKMQEEIGLNPTILWNATGQELEPWTIEECVTLLNEMINYVTPYIQKQQEIEIKINNSTNYENVLDIIINY